jgi:hypothetical protein
MNKLPEKIVLMTFNSVYYNVEYTNVLAILKEFFEEFPCMVITLDDGKDYYILPNSEIIKSTLNNIYYTLAVVLNIADLPWEIYTYDTVNPRIWDTYTIKLNTGYYNELPATVQIDPNDIKKLESLSEDED